MLEPLLTVDEAATILKMSPRTLKEWCRRGRINCVKVGREWRLREADVQAAIKPSLHVVKGGEILDTIDAAIAKEGGGECLHPLTMEEVTQAKQQRDALQARPMPAR